MSYTSDFEIGQRISAGEAAQLWAEGGQTDGGKPRIVVNNSQETLKVAVQKWLEVYPSACEFSLRIGITGDNCSRDLCRWYGQEGWHRDDADYDFPFGWERIVAISVEAGCPITWMEQFTVQPRAAALRQFLLTARGVK